MHGAPITDAERAEIKRLRFEDDLTYEAIAARVRRSLATVYKIFGRNRYANVTRPKSERPIPKFKPPHTGSPSGFIRPIDYSRLVARR